ncbi:restriction endonuclease subunit S [Lentibacillus salinarum]|uniref:Restriction endonuclease subunit S n=1 Tax=Lentibacillus salinarum TaxID=446820 RepID=A0ABW3ZY51_9BACI
MEQKKLVPKRRFEEFDYEWNTYILSDITDVYDGTHQTPKYVNKGVMFLSVENIRTLHSDKFISQEAFKEEFKNYPEKGDVLMTRIGDIGTGSVVEIDGLIAYYVSLALLKTKDVCPYFLVANISSTSVQRDLWRRTLHIAFPKKINKDEIKKVEINIPKKIEQQKIGHFFKQLDEMIETQQRKVEKTKVLKSAYLAEMFPAEGERVPKRRFAGFAEKWEERYLFDNIKRIIDFRGRTPKKLGLNWSDTGYPALSALNVKNGYIDFKADVHYGNQELYDKWMVGRDLEKGQVLFTTEAPMGNVAQVPDNRGYILSQRTIAFEVIPNKITNEFLAVLLRSPRVFKELATFSSGGTAKGVSQNSLEKLKVIVPRNRKEQQEIGGFFKQLNDKISNSERKLEKLKAMKQAYLKEMFV